MKLPDGIKVTDEQVSDDGRSLDVTLAVDPEIIMINAEIAATARSQEEWSVAFRERMLTPLMTYEEAMDVIYPNEHDE